MVDGVLRNVSTQPTRSIAAPAPPTPPTRYGSAPRRVVSVAPTPAPRSPLGVSRRPPNTVSYRPVARQAPPTRRVAVAVAPKPSTPVIDPVIWGPPLWRLLHTLAAIANTDTVWPTLLSVLRQSLPCPDCTQHYMEWYASHPIGGDGVGAVTEWLLALHNNVSTRNGGMPWSSDMLTATYSTVTIEELRTTLLLIRGKVGEQACQLIAGMIDRIVALA